MELVYAQVQNGKVIAISAGPSKMVLIESYNEKLLGTTYIGPTQAFANMTDFSGLKTYLSANKLEIAADGVETVTISIFVKNFEDVAAASFNGVVRLNINGSKKDLVVTNGQASYVYKTTVIGNKVITTQDTEAYQYISHGSVTVNAMGAPEPL